MKHLRHILLLGALSSAVALGLWRLGALDRWEQASWNHRAKTFARPGEATPRIKLILLDQDSLTWAERENQLSWPWMRQAYVPILQFCQRAGARGVVFDVIYSEASAYDVYDDQAFGEAIASTTNFVGALFLSARAGGQLVSSWPTAIAPPPWALSAGGGLPEAWTRPAASFPIPDVATNATALANVEEVPDADSIFRRVNLFRLFDGRVVPSLGLAAYLLERPPSGPLAWEEGWLRLGDQRHPVDAGGRGLLRFRGDAGAYESFSAAAIIQSELRMAAGEPPVVDPGELRGAWVFFGFSAPGLKDLRPTPMQPAAPGVVMHATLFDNLLGGDLLRDAPAVGTALLTVLCAFLFGAGVILARHAWQSAAVMVAGLALPVAMAYAAYPLGYWLPLVVVESGVALAGVGGIVVSYATEGRQRLFIKNAFRHYLSPAVIEKIIEDPNSLQLGGERRELTIFFSDLEKFSSFSERLEPPQLVALLNDYLSEMTGIIQDEGGTVDKYIGDAIVAFWNAPLAQADHARRAVRACLRCQAALDRRREEFKEKYGVNLRARIGLNTGEVIVGNMGSHERFDYSVLGDAANLASRLEGANKVFGTSILMSESTWEALEGTVPGRRLARIQVVGRKRPVAVYEPFGETPPLEAEALRRYEAAQQAMDCGAWGEALAGFEAFPDDVPSQRLAARCRHLLESGEAAGDGVWSLTEK